MKYIDFYTKYLGDNEMVFLEVIHKFEDKITKDACKKENPENLLTKVYIANSFLKFVKNLGIDEDDTYYLRWYVEEHDKNNKLSLTDFIYYKVLKIQDRMDISEEYLRLSDKLSVYKLNLEQKKTQYEEKLKTLTKDEKSKKDKIIYYKLKIENELKKIECFDKEYLIRRAWRNCTIPYFMRWFESKFSMNIYPALNEDIDRSDMIVWSILPVSEAEKMIVLKKENPSKYLEIFENMIYSMGIVEKTKKIAENNFSLNDRLPIISAAINLFNAKEYIAFVYLVTPQIEGLFRVFQQSIKGDNSHTSGMKELVKKMGIDEDFFEFTYFAYDFSEWRNKIAHGEMIKVDSEFACQIMIDLYWILNKIDSEEQDYKRLISFLNSFCSKQDLERTVEYLENYVDSIESEKNLKLLKRFLEGEFDSIIEWYRLTEKKQKFIKTIRSEELYLLIWNDERSKLESVEKIKVKDGAMKGFNIIQRNDNFLKYYDLLSLFNEYGYVPHKWYRNYLQAAEQMKEAEGEE